MLKEKISTLNEIHAKCKLSPELYDEIRKIIRYDHSRRIGHYQKFNNELPPDLQIKLALEIHKDIYETIDFFKDKPQEFVGWCVPMLKIMVYHEDQYIYQEGDSIDFLYFIEKGTAGFVLPR